MRNSANARVIGREIVHLSQCPDTSNYVAKAVSEGKYQPGTVILADYQTAGRGRRLKRWHSRPGQNLTFSFAVDTSFLSFGEVYLWSKALSVAVALTLEAFRIVGVAIKWPNDLVVEGRKIGGLLIENRGVANRMSICGVGLNVNQTDFEDLPKATSMARITGQEFERFDVLECLLHEIDALYGTLRNRDFETVSQMYFDRLYGSRRPIAVEEGSRRYRARILAVENDGALRIATAKGFEKTYYLDQVKVEYGG